MVKSREHVLELALKKIAEIYRTESLTPGMVKKVGIKKSWSVVIGDNGQCGMALNFTGTHRLFDLIADDNVVGRINFYAGKSLFDLAAAFLKSEHILLRSVSLAALNALSQPLFDSKRLKNKGFMATDYELSDFIRPDDVVTAVGFGGIVRHFAGKCRELHVTDMRPLEMFETTIIGGAIDKGPKNIHLHTADENEAVLGRSDVVLITGSTLVNDTFYEILDYSRNARVINIYGPSGQLAPDFLFEQGINHIRAIRIVDPARFEYDMENDNEMEAAVQHNQEFFTIYTREF